ncbi:family 16 glycosylhydrolase [Ochrovirga pacifica]|uniref:family 16 glycosylhydrolase n=1 Tax=Ochrovirga pacifica TaxID=1042376 RepID=UPI0002557FA9|nr:family 16 glycosylhydrolase [Ochrovirga pacifica]
MNKRFYALKIAIIFLILGCTSSSNDVFVPPTDTETPTEEEFTGKDDPTKPTFNNNQDPNHSNKKWVKVTALSDEFEGETLDVDKWNPNPQYLWGSYQQDRGWYGSSRSLFEPENATISEGMLCLEGEKFDNPKYSPQDKTNQPATRRYGGAYVYGKVLSEPGYYMEAKMKASKTAMSAAFWLMSEPKPCKETPNNGERSELDIQECVGVLTGELGDEWTKDDWAIKSNWDRIFHYNTHRHSTLECYNGEQQTRGGKLNFDQKNSEVFHIYGAYWYPDGKKVDFFIDGEFVESVTPAVQFTAPLRLIMSSNFYDWIEETTAEEMGFNNPLEERYTRFDWVRTWKLE